MDWPCSEKHPRHLEAPQKQFSRFNALKASGRSFKSADSDSGGPERGPRFCIANQLPVHASAAAGGARLVERALCSLADALWEVVPSTLAQEPG